MARQEPDAAQRRLKQMQKKSRGRKQPPSEQDAPEYYAKEREPSVAKPGPGRDDGDDEE